MDESVVRHLEQTQIGRLKLSAAIRIGAKIRPQCFRTYQDKTSSCAIGAAAEAMYGERNGVRLASKLFRDGVVPLGTIYSMNDRGYTREQIADWLESQNL